MEYGKININDPCWQNYFRGATLAVDRILESGEVLFRSNRMQQPFAIEYCEFYFDF